MTGHAEATPRPGLTQRYLERAVDGRMVAIIERYVGACGSVVDVACGSGLYGPYLRGHAARVVGIDHDPALCAHATALGSYDQVICDQAENLLRHVPEADVVFCSEFLEHLPNDQVGGVVDVLERVARRRIVVTVPNPRSPHYRMDETHVLRYSVGSLKRWLARSERFSWRLHPLGFADAYAARLWARPLNPLARRFATLSPTVLYLGERRGQDGEEAAAWR